LGQLEGVHNKQTTSEKFSKKSPIFGRLGYIKFTRGKILAKNLPAKVQNNLNGGG
jgi:hypothetical protein